MPQVSGTTVPVPPASPQAICPYCHQPILPTYYFCPNCGTKLTEVALSTSTAAQIVLYIFSIMLPVICYLFITRWEGWKYYRSKDPKTHQIGLAAIVLLIVSSIVTFWLAGVWVNNAIQSSLNQVNQEMSSGY